MLTEPVDRLLFKVDPPLLNVRLMLQNLFITHFSSYFIPQKLHVTRTPFTIFDKEIHQAIYKSCIFVDVTIPHTLGTFYIATDHSPPRSPSSSLSP